MSPLVDSIRSMMNSPRGVPVCLVCRRRVTRHDEQMQLRGSIVVHRTCATYEMRRRRTGKERLGYPRGGG